MRSIPAELKARIEKANMTLYENANPHMRIFVYNSRWNELFTVYTVHNKPNISRIDVTAKRETAEAKPNSLYAIYIEDGVSHVISKPLPYNEMTPWTPEFTAGSASDVAIEFNGYWQRDQVSKRFNFIADEYPWVFRQNGGVLTAQYWDETPFTLATGVGRICALRGWLPGQADHTQDQGLIVVYLKSGTAYYRNYCLQPDGTTYIWEEEREIEELPAGLTDIALFRTNDFRVGVLGRDASGQVHMTVTIRNWAGMSVWPEIAHVSIHNVAVELKEITYPEFYSPDEVAEVEKYVTYVDLCPLDYEVALTEAKVIDGGSKARLTFTYPILDGTGYESAFSIPGHTVTSTEKDGNGRLILSVTPNLPNGVTAGCVYQWAESAVPYPLRNVVTSMCRPPLYALNFEIVGEPPVGFMTETAEVSIHEMSVEVKAIQFAQGYESESAEVSVHEVSVVLKDLDGVPV